MDSEIRVDESAQQALAVTIYNDDLALVKDLRGLTLTEGENRLAWRGVSVQIRPETALLSETTGKLPVAVLEQNFDFDLLTPQSLLKKYVGRGVQVIRSNDAGERTVEEATVLAANDGVVLRYPDRIETGIVGHLAFPDVPDNLRDQPTLVLHLEAPAAGEGAFELSYLTGGLSWQADYVANLAADGCHHGPQRLGDPDQWQRHCLPQAPWCNWWPGRSIRLRTPCQRPVARAMAMVAEAPMPQEETLDQYHLYTLPRPTDIGNNQTKQVALLSAPGSPVTRELVVRGQSYTYRAQAGDGWSKLPVASMLRFDNQGGSLAFPLPEGVVRVYSKDSRGNAQFLGEDRIDHTPKGETVTLKLGESFDVTAKRKQTSFRKLSGTSAYNYAFEAGFETGAEERQVGAGDRQGAGGAARRLDPGPSQPAPHQRSPSNLASWQVEIPAEGRVTLNWLAQVRF